MTRRNFPNPAPRGEWTPTQPKEPPVSPCKASCCKSPYGHSTVRDHLPAWHKDACHCHAPQPVAERPASRNLDQLLAELDDNPKENR